MSIPMNRRRFFKASALAAATLPVVSGPGHGADAPAPEASPAATPKGSVPMGKIGSVAYSRLMLGGNLLTGYAHARDLNYVGDLMRRYNTDAKIRETLELAESQGINVINSWVKDGNRQLKEHWQRGGKMRWIAQARLEAEGGLDQFKQAADLGASAIHVTGDVADMLVRQGDLDTLRKILALVRSLKCSAGIGAHGLRTIVACEQAKLEPDFYVKTLHTHDYHTAPKPGETDDLGRYDNSWCSNPDEVVDVMFNVTKPWIAFKVLAAGAIPPERGFRHAFENGADFVLAGMFDWQIAPDVQIARQVLADHHRSRPWRS